jgi:hypothetical protein
MPEEIEVDIDKLHEDIHEELEREGGSLLKMVALTTALFAALAAVAALRAGGTVNEALVTKTEATSLQAEASDHGRPTRRKGSSRQSSRHPSRHGSRLANSPLRRSAKSANVTRASRPTSRGSLTTRSMSAIGNQPRPTI